MGRMAVLHCGTVIKSVICAVVRMAVLLCKKCVKYTIFPVVRMPSTMVRMCPLFFSCVSYLLSHVFAGNVV